MLCYFVTLFEGLSGSTVAKKRLSKSSILDENFTQRYCSIHLNLTKSSYLSITISTGFSEFVSDIVEGFYGRNFIA